jgi:hypothetical protein
VSDHEFLFALELSDEKTFDGMLAELAQAVLVYVGLGRPAIDDLSRALRGALTEGAAAGHGRCDVRFLAHAGKLQILVTYGGGARWQTTRPLP